MVRNASIAAIRATNLVADRSVKQFSDPQILPFNVATNVKKCWSCKGSTTAQTAADSTKDGTKQHSAKET